MHFRFSLLLLSLRVVRRCSPPSAYFAESHPPWRKQKSYGLRYQFLVPKFDPGVLETSAVAHPSSDTHTQPTPGLRTRRALPNPAIYSLYFGPDSSPSVAVLHAILCFLPLGYVQSFALVYFHFLHRVPSHQEGRLHWMISPSLGPPFQSIEPSPEVRMELVAHPRTVALRSVTKFGGPSQNTHARQNKAAYWLGCQGRKRQPYTFESASERVSSHLTRSDEVLDTLSLVYDDSTI